MPVEAAQVIRARLGLPVAFEITHQIYYMSLDGAMGEQMKPPMKWIGTYALHHRSDTQLPELTRC
jgi:hypothetical protein